MIPIYGRHFIEKKADHICGLHCTEVLGKHMSMLLTNITIFSQYYKIIQGRDVDRWLDELSLQFSLMVMLF